MNRSRKDDLIVWFLILLSQSWLSFTSTVDEIAIHNVRRATHVKTKTDNHQLTPQLLSAV